MKNRGPLDLGGVEATNAADPVSATSLATKSYVDAVATGLSIKASCRLATAAALPANLYSNGASGVGATLTGVSVGALTVDGVAVAVGDRILVKNEATASRNGIYRVTTAGSGVAVYVLTRSADFDQAADLSEGNFTFIEEGTANATEGWVLTTAGPFTIGTTSLTFTQFTAAGEYTAGSGILITGSAIGADFGTAAGKVTQGNDSRLSDARSPTAHEASHLPNGSDPLALGTPSIATSALAAGTVNSFPRTDHSHASFTVVRATDAAARNSGNTGTTLTNDDTLLFPIGSSATEIWWVEAFLLVSSANTAMDCKFAWSAPAGATASWGGLGLGNSGQAGFGTSGTAIAATAIGTIASVLPSGTNGSTMGLSMGGMFFGGGTSGNVVLQWAQNTSDASDLKLLKGSMLRVTKLKA